jgi:putative tricarboxylic transport membrane protein
MKATLGSFKGKTIWNYPTWPVLSAAEIIVPNSLTSGFGKFGVAVADAMKAEGLLKSEPVKTPNKKATYAISLDDFHALAGKSGKLAVTGFAEAAGVLQTTKTNAVSKGVPGARLMTSAEAIAVKANSPYKTLKQLMTALEKEPKSMAIVGGNKGGIDHFVASKLFEAESIPVDFMNYVPTKTTVEGDLLSDAKYAFGISDIADFNKYVVSGDLRILAISTPTKVAGVNAPTMKSAGVNLVVQNWRGIMLPPKTPVAAQKLVIRALDVVKSSATFKSYLTREFGTVSYLPGAKWGSYLKSEEARLTILLKASGLL